MNFKEQLEIIELNPFRYLKEIIAAILSIGLVYCMFCYVDKFIVPFIIPFFSRLRLDLNNKYLPISWSVLKLFVWFVVFLFIKEYVVYFLFEFPKRKRKLEYKLALQDWPQKWISQGGNEIIDQDPPQLIIKSSSSGCLLNRYIWKDFEMKFEMSSENNLGILFRAQNLGSYFMLQIRCEEGGLGVSPSVRISGNWDVIKPNITSKKIEQNHFFKVMLRVQENTAKIYVQSELVYAWFLPTYAELLLKQHEGKEATGGSIIAPKILFRNKFGMVGFRAYPGEEAKIKNLEIKSL